jgi:hypothetical protein
VMEKGWLAVIRIWRIYANDPIFVVLYLSFNFEMIPRGPSNKNLASSETETYWGVQALERGGKLLEGCQALERGGSSPSCGPTLERSGSLLEGGWCSCLMGCSGCWATAGRGPCSSFSCG